MKKLRSWHEDVLGVKKDDTKPNKKPAKKVLKGFKQYSITKSTQLKVRNVEFASKKLTIKSLGKRNQRRDGKSKRPYKYVRWVAPSKESSSTHISHIKLNDETIVLKEQQIPGYCVLCPKKGFFDSNEKMEKHYTAVHVKPSIIVGKMKLLKCKCSEVPNRGTDQSTRNSHYHCLTCNKPCDKGSQIAIHGITKHGYDPKKLDHLLKKKRK